ncbi:Flavin-binding monooxygenase-like family protein [Cladophialophora carrionii]|uniref:Flavin-binding monooxygenase-like family protein n=1 Tax=Cladophialophora carrionii TaxID=86049 RepID=A0A1C1C870_9EURO|nr:Flavin-binding monooxygenase-like family protein [Cladophialophora carrionii]
MATPKYPTRLTNVLRTLPGALPAQNVPADANLAEIVTRCLQSFETWHPGHFTRDAMWRDSFALSGTMRTFYSGPTIAAAWDHLARHHSPCEPRMVKDSCTVAHAGSDSSWIEARFSFRTNGPLPAVCSGFLSLAYENDGSYKIWVLRTILEGFVGYPSVDTMAREKTLGLQQSTKTDYQCLVIGGGAAGLSTAGRLKALGVDYLILEKLADVGGSWACRYNAAKLHGTRHTAHLPFERTFDDEYSLYPTKDEVAKGCRNIWLSTLIKDGYWDAEKRQWTLHVRRNGNDISLTAKHIVLAVGGGGHIPYMPAFPGRESYKGDVVHSSAFKDGSPWKGKRGIVIGAANTGHDIAEDLLEHGLSVTMVQRGATSNSARAADPDMVPLDYLAPVLDAVYNADFDVELADRIHYSSPAAMTRERSNLLIHSLVKANAERFDALERQGFKLMRFGDFFHHQTERQGGHYVDIGASAKIADGRIKVKSDASIDSFTPEGLHFSDGTEIKADVVVFATGFHGNMRQFVADLLGDDIASGIEDYWGLNAEGELEGAFKPTGHAGLWYMGGGCGHARYFSRFVALQIKADVEGKPLKIYKDTPSVVDGPAAPPPDQVAQIEPAGFSVDNLAVAPGGLAVQQQEWIRV